MQKFLTVEDVAELLQTSTSTIYKWCSARRIPYIRAGKRSLFDEAELLEWIASHRIEPVTEAK